jgi:hypothetical protein
MCVSRLSWRTGGCARHAALPGLRRPAGVIRPGRFGADVRPGDTAADLLAKIAAMRITTNTTTNIATNVEEATMMRAPEFEYRGHVIAIKVRQFSAESDTGIFLTNITLTPLATAGRRGEPVVLAKNSQGIYLDEAAAYGAAVAKARTYLDWLAQE